MMLGQVKHKKNNFFPKPTGRNWCTLLIECVYIPGRVLEGVGLVLYGRYNPPEPARLLLLLFLLCASSGFFATSAAVPAWVRLKLSGAGCPLATMLLLLLRWWPADAVTFWLAGSRAMATTGSLAGNTPLTTTPPPPPDAFCGENRSQTPSDDVWKMMR